MLHLTVSEWGDVSGQQEELRVTAEAFGSSSDVTKQHGGPAGTMTSSSGYETPRACALEHSQPHIPTRRVVNSTRRHRLELRIRDLVKNVEGAKRDLEGLQRMTDKRGALQGLCVSHGYIYVADSSGPVLRLNNPWATPQID